MSDKEREEAVETAPEDDLKPKRAAPVFVYLAVLFIAAFLMLLLAYFIQVRDGAAMDVPRETVTAHEASAESAAPASGVRDLLYL